MILNNKSYCQLSDCQTDNGSHVRTADGSCYDCSTTEKFNATESECNSCTTHERGWTSGGRCILKSSCVGYPYDADGVPICMQCSVNGGYSGDSSFAQERCEGCGGHIYAKSCFLNNRCIKGDELQTITFSGYNNCITCNTTEKIRIGRHEVEREYCEKCSVKRFWAGDYCYLCDTSETPDVTTDEEVANCISCGRQFKDGKCILKTME